MPQRGTPQSVPARDQFAPVKAVFIAAVHLGIIAVCWQTNWAAMGVCILLHAVCGGLGICVGYHRLLTHRPFKCSKAVEYALAFFGALTLEGGPIDWVAHHRQHHQFSDGPGDPHSAPNGFFWSHVIWIQSRPLFVTTGGCGIRSARPPVQLFYIAASNRLSSAYS